MPDSPASPSSAESCPGHDACAVCRAMGLRDGLRIWFGGNDSRAKRDIAQHLTGLTFPPTGTLDLAIIAAMDRAEADYFHAKVASRLVEGATAWICVREALENTAMDRAVRVNQAMFGVNRSAHE